MNSIRTMLSVLFRIAARDDVFRDFIRNLLRLLFVKVHHRRNIPGDDVLKDFTDLHLLILDGSVCVGCCFDQVAGRDWYSAISNCHLLISG